MCELLVRLVDKHNDDPVLDAQLHKAGDVIVVVPDGHSWGTEEVSNPDWMIIKCSEMDISEAQLFMSPEPKVEGLPDFRRARRAYRLRLENLSSHMTREALLAARYRVGAN